MIEAFSIAGEKFLAKKLADLRVESLDELPVALRRSIRKQKNNIDIASVYGEGFSLDGDGNPIEQGIGSAGNQTRHSIEAFKKHHDTTLPMHAEALKRTEKELTICNEQRRKSQAVKEKAELDELAEERGIAAADAAEDFE
jgi:DNA-binding winged helix-turn-helix (wHTH) protein